MSHEDEDDDDDMAELFSFGVDSDMAAGSSSVAHNIGDDVTAPSSRPRSNSDDSLIDMIESEGVKGVLSGGGLVEDHDAETQDILNWLDTEDETASELLLQSQSQPDEDSSETMLPVSPSPEPTVVVLPPVFSTLQEALASKESTSEQIRELALNERHFAKDQRPELYCRLVCNKTLQETQSSSLADSFEHWSQSGLSTEATDPIIGAVQDWTRSQACILAEKFKCNPDDLTKLLFYQLRSHGTQHDPLLPTVAATLLSTGMPLAPCSVVLHQMIANYMPLLHLPPTERWDASLIMHSELYLLAVYHLPLLVFHLDRHLPGWQWPQQPTVDQQPELEPTQKGRNLKSQGRMPPSWLLSHFTGECDGSFYFSLEEVLEVWDQTLTGKDSSLRFFLTLALLEQAADNLLLLTGDELKEQFESALNTKHAPEKGSISFFLDRADALRGATPYSVLEKLREAEDSAVQHTLQRRQELAERELKLKMEAEAFAHRLAQEKRAEEARERLNRARLVAFYRKHMPDKESNVETILVNYAGRLDVLEKKLKTKYGEGFNPAFKPKQELETAKENVTHLATQNMGNDALGVRTDETGESMEKESSEQVTVHVSASEVLPVYCWSKEASAARGAQYKRVTDQKYLKFCIVDCRTEAAAMEQGRFPMAMNLSPETMMDPAKLQDAEERFESMRGAAHITIMGDGYSALPKLYDYKLNPRTKELILEDQSRIQICALFFVKRGFPFVSILDGGYAASHSWLVREGPKHDLLVSDVLSEYMPDGSLFGQLETFHNASGAEKAQRRMQGILDKSLTVVAKRAQQLENFANELDNVEPTAAGFRSLFGRNGTSATKSSVSSRSDGTVSENKDGDGIKTFFSSIAKSFDDEKRKGETLADDNTLRSTDVSSSSSGDAVSSRYSEVSNDEKEGESVSPGSDSNGKVDDKAGSTPSNAFANLWRRGASSGSATAATPSSTASAIVNSKPIESTSPNPESGGVIGGFLKRNPFARLGGGGGPSIAKPSNSDEGMPTKSVVKENQPKEETVTFMDPTSDAEEEEVMFEIGESSELVDADVESFDTTTGEDDSKAQIQQV